MIIAKKIFLFLKSYWYVPIGITIAIISFILFRDKKSIVNWNDILDVTRSSHKKEIDNLDRIHKNEIKMREESFRRLEDARRQIHEEYRLDQQKIEKKKEKEIERILKKTKDDPKAMAEELEKATGYRVFVLESEDFSEKS